jgi:hypothetical protein
MKGNSMTHALAYHGQYYRVEIAEVVNLDNPDEAGFVSWCSGAFQDLQDLPSQNLSRFVTGPPLPTYADARRHAHEWIKIQGDARSVVPPQAPRIAKGIVYSVWLFKGDKSSGFEFEDFFDAKAFAAAVGSQAAALNRFRHEGSRGISLLSDRQFKAAERAGRLRGGSAVGPAAHSTLLATR